MKTLTKSRAFLVIGLLLLLVIAAVSYGATQTSFLTITYQDGSTQQVPLNQPAANITKLEFAGSSTTPPLTTGWAGKWKSGFGELTLTVSANQVSGNYTHDQGRISGTISADGRTLEGTWSEAPSYAPPNDSGRFVWKLAADGNSFSGTWGYGASNSGGTWNGTRISTTKLFE